MGIKIPIQNSYGNVSQRPTTPSTFQIADAGLAGTKKHVDTRLPSQRRLAMTWTTILSMHLLSVNVLVRNTFAYRTENLLIV